MSADRTNSMARAAAAAARTVVVKLGSAVLTGGGADLDEGYLRAIAGVVCDARARGERRVLLVSSGAIAAGRAVLGAARCADVPRQQAAAAAGQPVLMAAWREAFRGCGAPVAQLLLGRTDFDGRDRFLNIRNCVRVLLDGGVIPIANENDTVATEEITLGDNDVLAARLAVAVQANLLVLLTSAPGVLDAGGAVASELADAGAVRRLVRPERTLQGRGGMGTKADAAEIAGRSGIATIIGPGRPPEALAAMLAGDGVGTLVRAAGQPHAGRRSWLAGSVTPAGAIVVDDGAAAALRERGASLLARGIASVEGGFGVGDVVCIVDGRGGEIGRGLANLSAAEIELVRGCASGEMAVRLGRATHDTVVHRDNLALSLGGRGAGYG